MIQSKTEQLQIRVTFAEKAYIERAAKLAGLPMSQWVIKKLIRDNQQRFHQIVDNIRPGKKISYSLAVLNDFLTGLLSVEFRDAVNEKPNMPNDSYLKNYIAAMIEFAAHKNKKDAPTWVYQIEPLKQPRFASELSSFRLYLLTHSPPPFRKRNIFIDSSVGDQL